MRLTSWSTSLSRCIRHSWTFFPNKQQKKSCSSSSSFFKKDMSLEMQSLNMISTGCEEEERGEGREIIGKFYFLSISFFFPRDAALYPSLSVVLQISPSLFFWSHVEYSIKRLFFQNGCFISTDNDPSWMEKNVWVQKCKIVWTNNES